LLKGILICGIIVFAFLVFAVNTKALKGSMIAPSCLKMTKAVVDLIPQELKDKFRDAYQGVIGRRGKMMKKSRPLSIHKKMEVLIKELVEKELPIKEAIKEFEKIYIETAEKKYNGNKTRIAKALGIHRNTLHNLCKTLKIK